ncbi:type VII secretion-associated serine protease mycosin [Actinoplanes flavus]|uniref:Type VII secretion-associated serine protease mycosin n=1 Tax=Actinoplanes flavus TaxID=2820290 RepID=A0ABS3UNW1_9ACTN|nr:type VII secretion-associated serine protease mycosin [Actinoplanes flavus]MBO3740451.1 type VII secretion-associated serine protease mycosin [Actinoplanes flavus]
MKNSKKATALACTITAAIFSNFSATPAHADGIRNSQWHVAYLNLAQAHKITKGKGVAVAIIDSGVFPHRDLAKNLKKGHDTVSGGDGTGHVDKDGHGTHMAGVIGGHGHNDNDGVIGIAPDVQLIPVKSIGVVDNGLGLEAGIKWAAGEGADVINVSTGGPQSRGINEAVAAAIAADSVVVAATGNKSETLKLGFPAAIPDVLAVAATDRNGNLAEFSVTGPEVDICAPGVEITTTDLNNRYGKGSGTSEATAIVSGAAALVRAKFPDLSAAEVIHRLTATADDNGPPGRDDQCGYGVLNVVKALTADVPPLEGGTAATASAQPSAAAPSVASSSAATDPETEADESNLPVIASVAGGIAVLGVLLAFLVRRRRKPTA